MYEVQSDILAEAKVDSLNDLFNRDPESYTAQDRALIVAVLRKQREEWMKAEAAGKPRGKAASPKLAPGTNVSADDLDL